MSFDDKKDAIHKLVEDTWDNTIVPCMVEYIKIPSQSPDYDKEWQTNGLQEKAMDCLLQWVKKELATMHRVKAVDLHQDAGKTPFLLIEVDGTEGCTADTVLMYGHMAKQPPMDGWAEGLGPYTPVYRDGLLYGRGGADDGYAVCSAITAIKALQSAGVPHPRVVITIEGREESGSEDLPGYIEKCKAQIGNVGLVICLDSGAFSYDRLWLTGSLRGITYGTLVVEGITDPCHSGISGGVVPCPFRIARSLLDRVEDPITGTIKLGELYCPVPPDAKAGFKRLDDVGPDIFLSQFAFPPNLQPEVLRSDQLGLLTRNNWFPCLTVTGIDGYPATSKAGNVIRSRCAMRLSVRVPPHIDCEAAGAALKRVLEVNPPYGAKVEYKVLGGGNGWAAAPLKPWLQKAIDDGSTMFFGAQSGYMALGGSIPFMKMLGDLYPESQFVITGVLGPKSNAHGPNEFLHVPFAKKLTSAVAKILAEQYKNLRKI